MGSGKADEVRDVAAERRRGRHPGRSRALAQPGAQSREAHRPARARSQQPDPRHLRAARAQPRRQARSGARAAQAHRQPPRARLDPPRAPEGRHRHARSRRDAARDGSPPARPAREGAHASGWRRSSSSARPAARSAREIPVPSVALVGYTNAGKSTLFRASPARMPTSPTSCSRRSIPPCAAFRLPGGTPVVVADTVGFIRELPHELVAAFQSTLTEAREATLLLHVIDASDPRREEHITQVNGVLAEIGADQIPQVLVYNKIDRLEIAAAHRSRRGRPRGGRVDFRRAAARAGPARRRDRRTARARRAPRDACACRRAPGRCARGCTRPGAVRSERSRGGRLVRARPWSFRTWSCSRWRARPASRSWTCRRRKCLVRPGRPYLQSAPFLSANKLR